MNGRIRLPAVMAVVAAVMSVLLVGAAFDHGLAAMHRQQRLAALLDRRTAVVNAAIAHGRFAAAHRISERSRAAALTGAIPPTVDDQSILASAVTASAAAKVTLADEQRAASSVSGSGLARVPVTLDVNAGGAEPLVAFAGVLQEQPRRFVLSALEFSSEGGATLHLTGSVYTAAATGGVGRTPS
jgi:hypothetical protein